MDTNTAQQIAETTLAQLGGAGKLRAMIAMKNQMFDAKGALSFKFPGSKSANYANIELVDDLYTVRLCKLGRAPSFKVSNDRTFEHVGAEQLRELFERETQLRLSL